MTAVQQQERTQIIGAIVNPGDATVTVTKSGMAGSPLAITVAVVALDTASIVAGKMAAAMNLDAAFSAVCHAYAISDYLYVLVLTAAANDDTMNIAYANGTCTGLTDDATSDAFAIGDSGAIVYGYTTLAAIKNVKRITSTDATDDGVIENMIEAASRYIDHETQRRFHNGAADETRTYTAPNGERLYVDDLLTVTTLKTDDDGDRTYESTWAATDYDLLPENASTDGQPYTYIQITPDGDYTFPSQRKGVQIVGRFGYCATGSHPVDIEQACIDIVVNLYNRRYGVGQNGVGSDTATITGAGVVITPHDVPESAWKTIKYYRRFN